MGDNTRTKKVALNAAVGLACQLANMLFAFVNRYVFVMMLGTEYLGVKGLFTNVLQILSFAELGFGSAIVFGLYKPLATNDREKIKSLMKLYAKAYRVIGTVVALVGLALVPFLNVFIKSTPNIPENITLLYLLYLADTAVSYFFTHKRSLISADQRNYVITLYDQGIGLVLCLGQIVILYFTRNFILYLVLQIIATVVNNVLVSRRADRDYPYIKEKANPLTVEEQTDIFKNVRALVFFKFGSVVLNSTDNILLSWMFGLNMVGLCSNYLLIINTIRSIIGKLLDAFTASVGNVNAVESVETRITVFNRINLITTWIYGFVSVGLMLLVQDFLRLWLGDAYALSLLVVFSLVLHFYIQGVHNTAYTYRITIGYFSQVKAVPLVAAFLNLALSILLGRVMGVAGVFFATSIARQFVSGIVDPVMIYRGNFGLNPMRYYVKYVGFMLLFAALYFLLGWVLSFIALSGVFGFLVKGVIVTLLFNGIMVLIFFRTKDFRETLQMGLGLLKEWRKK